MLSTTRAPDRRIGSVELPRSRAGRAGPRTNVDDLASSQSPRAFLIHITGVHGARDRARGQCCSVLRDRARPSVGRSVASTEPHAGSGARGRSYLENCIAAVGVLYISSQDIKGARWMPWRQKPMKDVDGCDKPR